MFIFRTGLNELNKMQFVAAKQMWMHLKDNDMRLLKYWIEAYLSNVGALYLGYKDKKGMIREPIECLKLRDIPKVVEMFIDKFVYFVNRKKNVSEMLLESRKLYNVPTRSFSKNRSGNVRRELFGYRMQASF